jgi:ubiquinone/menaquinone biosynthesis C-methylase UbiE
MSENFWDTLMGSDDGASQYMLTYGEGPGSETRHIIGGFINEGETILDVGCGPGWNLDHFQQYGPKVGGYRGLDYSERFVRVANQRHPVNRRFRIGDCRKLKEPKNSWDVVILQDVLEHTNGYEGPIREAIRVARKRVIISFWHLVDDDNEHINDDGNDGYGAWYDGTVFKKFLDSSNLHWMETESSPEANRQHRFFIIDKVAPHGN